jgi:ATP-dependent Clp protease, protease subunit
MGKRVNRDDVDKFHDYKLYIPTRTIYMGSEIIDTEGESGCDAAMAERTVKNLHILDTISSAPITILMNNIGGDEYHGFAIYDMMRLCKSKIIVKVMGHAMSMGSIILQAADERLMAPTSRQMIHYGTWGYEAHAKTSQKWAQEGLKIDKWMEKMYLAKIHEKHPTFTLDKLKEMLDHDTFLTAEESVRLGLADGVLPLPRKEEE